MPIRLKKGIPKKSYGRMSYRNLRERASTDLSRLSEDLKEIVLKGDPIKEGDIDNNISTGKFRDSSFAHGGFTVMFTMEHHEDDRMFLHLSISRVDRYPSWDEIVLFRSLFFDDDDTIFQVIPKEGDYVNVHSNCFHLWKDLSDPKTSLKWLS